MRKRLTKLALMLAGVALLAVAGAVIATAARSGPSTVGATATQTGAGPKADAADPTEANEPAEAADPAEAASDAREAAACKAAGLDPNAENVEYDEHTGVCAIETHTVEGP